MKFMNRRAGLSVIALVALLTLARPCAAQSQSQFAWTDSTTTKVKPEMRREFERSLQQLVAGYRKAGIPWFLTFETFAGDTNEFTTVAPVAKFGDLDGPAVSIRVLGEVEWKRWSRRIERNYTSQTRQFATPQAELEIDGKGSPVGLYWVETRTLVAAGKMGDYLNLLRNDYRPALEKAGVTRFQVSQPIFGAAAGEILIRRMLRNLAEIDEGAVLSKALKEEEVRAIAAKSAAMVSSSHSRIVRLRPDLSY